MGFLVYYNTCYNTYYSIYTITDNIYYNTYYTITYNNVQPWSRGLKPNHQTTCRGGSTALPTTRSAMTRSKPDISPVQQNLLKSFVHSNHRPETVNRVKNPRVILSQISKVCVLVLHCN